MALSAGGSTRFQRAVGVLAAVVLALGAGVAPAGGAPLDPTPEPAPANTPVASTPIASAAATSADRIAGDTRFTTAVAISTAAFPTGASRVFLANGVNYPDALSAAPIAAALDAPLLLTTPSALPTVVIDELARLAAAEVTIVGGTGVVSSAVEQQLVDLGYRVSRSSGIDRYATSRALIEAHALPSTTLYLATGRNYPDALAAAAAAGSIDAPVLLVDGFLPALDAETLALIAARGVQSVLIAGGAGVVPESIEQQLVGLGYATQRLAGLDRYATAVAINDHAFPTASRAFVATGAGFADALAGAVHAAIEGGPLYSSMPLCLPRGARGDMLDRLRVERVTLFGGTGVLGPRVQALESCTSVEDDRAASAAELTAALQLRLASLAGTYSVSVRELEGLQTSVSIRGTVMQEPVSVIKIFVAYAVLDRIDQGRLSVTTPTRSGVSTGDCLRAMIHVSDNYCHWDLVALVGQQNLNNQFWAEGYLGTVYQGYNGAGTYYSSKFSTTDDLALLLSRLQHGELLSPALTEHLFAIIETQLWRSKIPSSVEEGVPVGNKTGSAYSAAGWWHSDAGVVHSPAGPYVVTVLGANGASSSGVRALARVVYEHFNGPVVTAATFSNLNSVTTGAVTYYRYGSSSTPLGTIPAGTRIEVDSSARLWYRVFYNGQAVYVHSTGLRNAISYPRSER